MLGYRPDNPIEEIKKENDTRVTSVWTKEKRWGEARRLFTSPDLEIWHASIKHGGYSSIHEHKVKTNEFYVVSGELEVRIHKYDTYVSVSIKAGQTFAVAPEVRHSFIAHQPTELIEIYKRDMPEDIERHQFGGVFEKMDEVFYA